MNCKTKPFKHHEGRDYWSLIPVSEDQNTKADREELVNAKEQFKSHGTLPQSLLDYLSTVANNCCKEGWTMVDITINDNGEIEVIIVESRS